MILQALEYEKGEFILAFDIVFPCEVAIKYEVVIKQNELIKFSSCSKYNPSFVLLHFCIIHYYSTCPTAFWESMSCHLLNSC